MATATQQIQAIETRYKGYKFRSRLEARWAVFFDNIGVQWEYEKEGFNLPDAGYYLPDFWIEDWECWVEIKPVIENQPETEFGYVRSLLSLSKESCVLLVMGRPWVGEHKIHLFDHGKYEFDFNYYCFTECAGCDCGAMLSSRGFTILNQNKNPHCTHIENRPESGSFSRAYRAARESRFEHGATP